MGPFYSQKLILSRSVYKIQWVLYFLILWLLGYLPDICLHLNYDSLFLLSKLSLFSIKAVYEQCSHTNLFSYVCVNGYFSCDLAKQTTLNQKLCSYHSWLLLLLVHQKGVQRITNIKCVTWVPTAIVQSRSKLSFYLVVVLLIEWPYVVSCVFMHTSSILIFYLHFFFIFLTICVVFLY